MKKQTEKYMSIQRFAEIMELNKDARCVLGSKMATRARNGQIDRITESGTFQYKESDLLSALDIMKLNASESIPSDCLSIREYILLHPEKKHRQDAITKKLSDWARYGRIYRYSKNGRVTNYLYHLRDIENALSKDFKQQPRTSCPRPETTPQKTYHPGIFVRIWRWLFGYNN